LKIVKKKKDFERSEIKAQEEARSDQYVLRFKDHTNRMRGLQIARQKYEDQCKTVTDDTVNAGRRHRECQVLERKFYDDGVYEQTPYSAMLGIGKNEGPKKRGPLALLKTQPDEAENCKIYLDLLNKLEKQRKTLCDIAEEAFNAVIKIDHEMEHDDSVVSSVMRDWGKITAVVELQKRIEAEAKQMEGTGIGLEMMTHAKNKFNKEIEQFAKTTTHHIDILEIEGTHSPKIESIDSPEGSPVKGSPEGSPVGSSPKGSSKKSLKKKAIQEAVDKIKNKNN